jgi:hypothetical protein
MSKITNRITAATEWAGSLFPTEAAATRACVQDWLTASNASGGPNAYVLEHTVEELAHELLTTPDARRWITREEDEDGHPVLGGLQRVETREQAEHLIHEILDSIMPEDR